LSREPEPLELHYSRPWALFVLVAVTAWTAWGAYVCLALQHVITAPLAAFVFAPFGFFFVAKAIACVRRLLHHGPVLTLDYHGITDLRRSGDTVAWSDIANVELVAAGGGTALMVRFRSRDAAREYLGALGAVGGWFNRLHGRGEWTTMLTSLSYRRAEVLRTAKAFIVRERVEAARAASAVT
jgi:hypothetical protein